MRVLITDYAWPNFEIERKAITATGAEVIAAPTGEQNELMELAPGVDGILSNWLLLRAPVIAVAEKCQIICRYGVGPGQHRCGGRYRAWHRRDQRPGLLHGRGVQRGYGHSLLCGARGILGYDCLGSIGRLGRESRACHCSGSGVSPWVSLGSCGIGKSVAPKAQGFGLHVIACDPYIDQQEMTQRNVKPVDLDTLLRTSDFVTIHTPLTPETHKMIGAEALTK